MEAAFSFEKKSGYLQWSTHLFQHAMNILEQDCIDLMLLNISFFAEEKSGIVKEPFCLPENKFQHLDGCTGILYLKDCNETFSRKLIEIEPIWFRCLENPSCEVEVYAIDSYVRSQVHSSGALTRNDAVGALYHLFPLFGGNIHMKRRTYLEYIKDNYDKPEMSDICSVMMEFENAGTLLLIE